MNEEKPFELNIPGIDPNTISLNGELYFKGQKVVQLPTTFGGKDESVSDSDLESKIYKELDGIFDNHANEKGVSRNAYQDAIEYLRKLIDANFARIILLKKNINSGVIPAEFAEYVDTREEFFAVKEGEEDVFSHLKNEGKLYNIATSLPANDIVEDDVTKEGFKGLYELKLKNSDALAIIELYGIQNNDQTKKIISTFNEVMDTKVHRDITSAQSLIDIITMEEVRKQEITDSLLDMMATVTGTRLSLDDLNKVKMEKVSIGTTEEAKEDRRDISGHYYTNDSFFSKYKMLIDYLLDHPHEIKDLKGIALEFLNLPDYTMVYNRKKSDQFISEEELVEKLSKLIIASTIVWVVGKEKLNDNLSVEQLEKKLLENKKIYEQIIGNGMIGLYSLFPKRARTRDENGKSVLVYPQLENSNNNLAIFSALNGLWFGEKGHFVYDNKNTLYHKEYKTSKEYEQEINDLRKSMKKLIDEGNNISRGKFKTTRDEDEQKQRIKEELERMRKIPMLPYRLIKTKPELRSLVDYIKTVLPKINDNPERSETRQIDRSSVNADLVEACTIFMNYNQRVPFIIPGYESEGPKPHTIRESLQFLRALGYRQEAGLIGHAVYLPFPFKSNK